MKLYPEFTAARMKTRKIRRRKVVMVTPETQKQTDEERKVVSAEPTGQQLTCVLR